VQQIQQAILYEWKSIVKRAMFAISIPLISILYPILNQERGEVFIIKTCIDNFIPFNKYFIIPYIGWYLYVGIFVALVCILNEARYYKLIISICVGMGICYVIYYIFPTHVPRPIILENDFFSNLVKCIYSRDNPYNCLPSIHVLNSMIVAINVCAEEKMNSVFKIISSIIAILIILSTMFIKQHYIADAISSIALSYFLYFIFEHIKFNRKSSI
jgi:membrane-associated phospholipid phosphatase